MTRYRELWLVLLLLFSLSSLHTHTTAQADLPDDFPLMTVNVNRAPAEGLLYLTNFRRTDVEDHETGFYLMTLTNEGAPTFWQRIDSMRAFNFGVGATGERYYYQVLDNGLGNGSAMDGVYRVLDDKGDIAREYRIQGGNTDPHEFILQENGNAILISNPIREMDLTAYGGDPEAQVVGLMLQEVTADGEVAFQWEAWDYFSVADTVEKNRLKTKPPKAISYIHGNGVALDLDGDWIVSLRAFDMLIKIDRTTGDILWRMGGQAAAYNDFTFINDPLNGFSGQHHPTILPNGNLLLFDNGDRHQPRQSRVVEYALDEVQHIATLVWSYSDGRYTGAMGSAQRLSNGNTLIGWGSAPPDKPGVTEVNPAGEVVFALSLPPSQINYRVYRVEP